MNEDLTDLDLGKIIMRVINLPDTLSTKQKYELEDFHDNLFPDKKGKITPFIAWLFRDTFWIKRRNFRG
jgi:hypothetical protein